MAEDNKSGYDISGSYFCRRNVKGIRSKMDIHSFWRAVLQQDADKMRMYFEKDAYVNWHCTNEHFSVEEYIRANCEYPGKWDGTIERIENMGDLTVAVVNVYAHDKSLSFHVVSFMKIKDDRIASLDEYWGDDGIAPQWRLDKGIGTVIKLDRPGWGASHFQ